MSTEQLPDYSFSLSSKGNRTNYFERFCSHKESQSEQQNICLDVALVMHETHLDYSTEISVHKTVGWFCLFFVFSISLVRSLSLNKNSSSPIGAKRAGKTSLRQIRKYGLHQKLTV